MSSEKVKGPRARGLSFCYYSAYSATGKEIFACNACKMDNATISSPDHGVFAPLETN